MEATDFLEATSKMAKWIVGYLEGIRGRRVLPDVEPGYMARLLPRSAPEEPETFSDVFNDIESIIMPGVTHWHSPRFNAFFPTGSSYPAILADMLSDSIGCIGFTWIASPACTELEVHMLEWLGDLIGLPEEFLSRSGTPGGGVIQGTASEATLVALLSAKKKVLSSSKVRTAEVLTSSLVAYASDQSHSSVERAAMLGGVTIRLLSPNDECSLRGATLRAAIEEDLRKGLIPFFVVATAGTTNSCSFDNIREIGAVANEFELWTHVDAAYAGSAFVCEEFRHLMDGVELVQSFNFNPHKWLLVNFDCSAMWVKDSSDIVDAFNVDPLYLKHQHQGLVPDYRHWQIPLGRRFRSLKLWFVMRLYGRSGLQKHIRKHVSLAKEFEGRVRKDQRFEVIGEVILGLVCFRLKGSNEVNERLLKAVTEAGVVFIVPAKIKDTYFLRYAVCSSFTESSDVAISWSEVAAHATRVLAGGGDDVRREEATGREATNDAAAKE